MCLKGYTRVEGGNKGGHLGIVTITMATRSLPNDEHKGLFSPKLISTTGLREIFYIKLQCLSVSFLSTSRYWKEQKPCGAS